MDLLETPSRILRRIKDHDARGADLPSLPSFSVDDLADGSASMSFPRSSPKTLHVKEPSESEVTTEEEEGDPTPGLTPKRWGTPGQQHTPVASSAERTVRRQTPGSSGSRVRFSNSLMKRSFGPGSRRDGEDGSFNNSKISYVDEEETVPLSTDNETEGDPQDSIVPNLQQRLVASEPDVSSSRQMSAISDSQTTDQSHSRSSDSIPAVYLPDSDEEDENEGISLASVARPPSQTGTPSREVTETKSLEEYSASIRTETRGSPFDPSKWSNNLARRRPLSSEQRVPSLSGSVSESDTSISTPDAPSVTLPSPARSVANQTLNRSTRSDMSSRERVTVEESNRSANANRSREREDIDQPEQHERTPSITFSTPSSLKSQSPPAQRSPFGQVLSTLPARAGPRSPFQPLNSISEADTTNATTRPKNYFTTPHAMRAFQLITSSARPRMKAQTPRPIRRARFSLQPGDSMSGTPNRPVGPSSGAANDSFTSSASSHDLTIHPRANASFDMISNNNGRLDKARVNKQLDRINHLLGQENAELTAQTTTLKDQNEQLLCEKQELLDLVGALRDGIEQHEAQIDMLQSGMQEDEREDLYDELEALGRQFDATKAEKEQQDIRVSELQAALHNEQAAHVASKQGFEERLSRAQEEAEKVVEDLTSKYIASEAEIKTLRKIVENRDEEIQAMTEKLQGEGRTEAEKVRRAEERAEELRFAKEDAEDRIVGLEKNVNTLQAKCDAQKTTISQLESRLHRTESDLSSERTRSTMLEADLEALRATHARTTQDLKEIEDHLEETAQQLVREHEALEDALARLNSFQGHTTDDAVSAAKLTEMEEEVERMRVEKERAEQAEKLMESALEDAEKAALAFEQEKASLNVRIAVLEREKNDLEILLTEARAGQANHTTHSVSGKSRGSEDDEQISLFHHDEVISKLERELEEAQREIGRLRFRIADSPAREALQNVKDVQIKLLEEQKKELVEQVNALRRILGEHVSIWEADASGLGQATPARPGSRKTSGQYTPARSMSMRASRTAAHGAIKDMSWGSHVSPLGSGIHSILPPLQHEASELMQQLQAANDRLDAKFEELQRNGLQGVSLTKQLDDAREKGVALQSEVERLLRREERLLKRLERCRCLKCGRRFDASGLASWAKSGNQSVTSQDSSLTINTSSKSTTAIKATLANTNAELATLKAQRDLLQNERQTLEDQARKLNLDVERANSKAQRAAEKVEALRHEKDEGDRLREHLQSERDAAKKLAKEFEEDLVKDRLRLQELESQRSKLAHDMNVISAKLKQKDVEMANVLAQLEKAKQRSRDLEEQLKDHSAVGHKSRHLEQKVVDNQNVIQQLRQDRENLHQDTEKLKRKLDQVSKDAENLRKHLRVAQSEHENRRHQQEIHLGELEDYHNDDGRAQPGVKRHDGELTDLRAEVSRLKKEVMRFAQDLKELRQERDALLGRRDDDKAAAERAATIAQSRERALKERLAEVERRANGLEETWSGHVCASEQSIQAVKAQHRNECKGLFVQIHYMKDRVRREATMRSDLAYQKKYLLDIIAVMEKSEKSILASIARIGFPMPAEPPKRKSLKRYAFMVLFIARVRRESQQWQEKSARKDAVMAALEDVRKRRSITNVVSTVPQ